MHRFTVGCRGSRDAGATALEFTGVILAVALVVSATSLVVLGSGTDIGGRLRAAVCELLSLGTGDCGTGTRADGADRRPTTPCVVTSRSSGFAQEVSVFSLVGAKNRTFEVAKLDDGRNRVTLLEQGRTGLEFGVGAEYTMTYGDRTYGRSAVADAGGFLGVRRGQVWYVDDAGLAALERENTEDAWEEFLLPNQGARNAWEHAQDLWGRVTGRPDTEFRRPDEQFFAGGSTLNARAEVTALTTRAGAEVGRTNLVGVRLLADGRRTVYLRTSARGSAGLQVLGISTTDVEWSGAQVEGDHELVTAATFDSTGALTEVSSTTSTLGGTKGAASVLAGGHDNPSLESNKRTELAVHRSTLRIRSAADRAVAERFLQASGAARLGGPFAHMAVTPRLPQTEDFMAAARGRGEVTRQRMKVDSDVEYGGSLALKGGIVLGGGAELNSGSRTALRADYWDGRRWQAWQGCSAQ